MQVSTVIDNPHDGKVLCAVYNQARNELYTGGEDHSVKAWSVRTGQLLGTMQAHKGWVTCVVYIPSLKYIVSGSIDGTICVWTENYLEVQVVEFSGGVFCLGFCLNKSMLIAGGNATFALYKAQPVNIRQLTRFHNRQRMIKTDRARQRNTSQLVDDSNDFTFRALDTTGRGMMQFKGADSGHTDVIKTILPTANGRFITAGFDHRILLWDIDKIREVRPFPRCHTAAITQLVMDTFSNYLLSCSFDGTVRTWNMEGRSLDTFDVSGEAREISACYVAPVKQYWICSRHRVLTYDPRSPANITEYTMGFSDLDKYDIWHLESTEGSDVVAGLSRHNEVVLWTYNPMGPHRTLESDNDLDPSTGWIEHLIVVRLSSSIGGEHIFTSTNDGMILNWRLDEERHTDVYNVEVSQQRYPGSYGTLRGKPIAGCWVT